MYPTCLTFLDTNSSSKSPNNPFGSFFSHVSVSIIPVWVVKKILIFYSLVSLNLVIKVFSLKVIIL